MFTQDRTQLRNFYREAWRKHRDRLPMTPLETAVAQVVAMHPEYHVLLEASTGHMDREYAAESGQTNPFLHMGLHIALREQLSTNRPAGVSSIYQRLLQQNGDPHAVEHQMIECLGQTLWEAQRSGTPPDEAAYAECLRRLVATPG
jgi:hypothetical protein